jgi:hypothetical protein
LPTLLFSCPVLKRFDKNNYHLLDNCQTIEFFGRSTLLEDSEGRVSVFSGAVLKQRSSFKRFCSVLIHYMGVQCMDFGQIKSFYHIKFYGVYRT